MSQCRAYALVRLDIKTFVRAIKTFFGLQIPVLVGTNMVGDVQRSLVCHHKHACKLPD